MIPDLVPGPAGCDVLPVGRYQCSLDEARVQFVDRLSGGSGTSRREWLWSEFLGVTEAIRSVGAAIPAAFMGGSFTTNTPEPDDIDVSYLVDRDSLDEEQIGRLDALAQIIVQRTKVQSIIIYWRAVSDGAPNVEPTALHYVAARGKWDDWWQRDVARPVRLSGFAREHAFPKRGYLEVVLDGYR